MIAMQARSLTHPDEAHFATVDAGAQVHLCAAGLVDNEVGSTNDQPTDPYTKKSTTTPTRQQPPERVALWPSALSAACQSKLLLLLL